MGVFSGVNTWWMNTTGAGKNHAATQAVVQSGLILNLDAGASDSYGGSGTTWTDLSSSGNNGLLNNMNGSNFNSSNGGYFTFDGSNENVTLSAFSTLTNFSIESWFRPTSYPNNYSCIITDAYANGDVNFKLGYEGGSDMVGGFYNGTWRLGTSVSTTLNTWHHIVFTYDKTSMKTYSNGVLQGSVSETSNPDSGGSKVRMGRRWDQSEFFPGHISVCRLYNKALTADEAKLNYDVMKGRFGL
tara:strand:+ start:637 stop:1365 length:729 start_codon:yes stop_codon:yes gene_type:complete